MMAWTAGFFGAARQAFVGDGSDNNWTIHRNYFSSFTPILDFIHALSYVFASAMTKRPFADGWKLYVQWIGWVWKGEVEQSDRGVGATATGVGHGDDGGRRNESAPNRGEGVDVSAKPPGQNAIRRIPPAGAADHKQLCGVGGEAIQPACEGDGKVLVGRRSRSDAATAWRLLERQG